MPVRRSLRTSRRRPSSRRPSLRSQFDEMDWKQSRRKSRRAKLPGSRKRRRSKQRVDPFQHVPLRFKFAPAPVPYKFAPQPDHIATKLSVHGMNKEQADALLGRNLAAAAPVPHVIPFGM
jgi:hypothetical protein